MMTVDEWIDTKRLIADLSRASVSERRANWDVLVGDVLPCLLSEVQELRAEVAQRDGRIAMLESTAILGLQEVLRRLERSGPDVPALHPMPTPSVAA